MGADKPNAPALPTWVHAVAALVQDQIGYTVHDNRLDLLVNAVTEAAEASGYGDPLPFVTALREAPSSSLMQALVARTTIKETYFFRDTPAIDTLRSTILPRLLQANASSRQLRIWSAGCSTGEEIYTLAVLLDDLVGEESNWQFELTGTDIDTRAIEAAQRAVYGSWSLRACDDTTRRRLFEPAGKRFALRSRYKRFVRFSGHNLVDPQQTPPAPGQFDLILCRNVAIYFVNEGLRRLYGKLSTALAPGGLLLTGPSDPAPPADAALAPANQSDVIAYVHASALRTNPPDPAPKPRLPSRRSQTRPSPAAARLPAKQPKAQPVATPRVALNNGRPSVRDAISPTAVANPTHREASEGSTALAGLLDRARASANGGRFDEAHRLLATVLSQHPMHLEAHLLNAAVAQERHDPSAAERALRRALYLEPRTAIAHLRLGLLCYARGENSEGERCMRNALTALDAPAASPLSPLMLGEMSVDDLRTTVTGTLTDWLQRR